MKMGGTAGPHVRSSGRPWWRQDWGWGLGWAPAGRKALSEAALSKGFKEEYLVDTGLSIKYDDDGVYCLCVLPYGNEIFEKDEQNKKREGFSPSRFWIFALGIFVLTIISSTIGTIIAHLLLHA